MIALSSQLAASVNKFASGGLMSIHGDEDRAGIVLVGGVGARATWSVS